MAVLDEIEFCEEADVSQDLLQDLLRNLRISTGNDREQILDLLEEIFDDEDDEEDYFEDDEENDADDEDDMSALEEFEHDASASDESSEYDYENDEEIKQHLGSYYDEETGYSPELFMKILEKFKNSKPGDDPNDYKRP